VTGRTKRIPLDGGAPGTARTIAVHRYGTPGARPKAHLQAALHADEIPGLLVLHHLMPLLVAADDAGQVSGEVVVVPYANPIGLDQFLNGRHSGRVELAGGGNFNRNWPNLAAGLADAVAGQLGDDATANAATVRTALLEKVAALPAVTELQSLQRALLGLAIDADLVLDLHCDTGEALVHLFTLEELAADLAGLAAELGAEAVLLGELGGGPFDETCSTPWRRLREACPDRPIPMACASVTVELRGQGDVSDELARADAQALFRSLQRSGVITGDPGPLPAPRCEARHLNTCEVLRAPVTGVLAYNVALGDAVKTGDTVAWLVDPAAAGPEQGRHPVLAGTDGVVMAINLMKYAMAGWSIAKIAGSTPLARGHLGEGEASHPE